MVNILDNTPDSIWAIDKNYQILYLNNAFTIDFKKAFGVTLKNGDNILEKLPEQHYPIWENRYNKALNGHSYTFEESFKDNNDKTIFVNVSLSPIKSGKEITGVTCFGRDITKERQNEIALQKYSILLKSSLESQRDTILLSIDKKYRYMYFNSAHYEVMKYAYNAEIAIGKNMFDFISDPDDRNAAQENFSRALKGETHSNVRVYGTSNKEYYESFFNPIRDRHNEIIGATALARNITKRIAQEEALKKAIITKDKFFSIISHDLRSPISSLAALLNLLIENFDEYDAKTQKSYLQSICKVLDTTYNLLEELLLWSNTQNNSIEFRPEKINLADIVDNMVNVFHQNITNKALLLTIDMVSPFEIYADKQMIATIIRNLLSNAIKFSHKQGTIEIRAERVKENTNERAMIFVVDYGVGIPNEKISKLFDIGEDISTPGTEHEKGTGLGLMICKEFVDKHKGTINIASEINKGTRIEIILPQ